jgi:hypothetical protein
VVASSIVAAVVNIAASIVLTRKLGMAGPLLGTTLAFVTVSLWNFPWLLHRVFGTSIAALAQAVAVPLAWGLVYASGLWWISHHHEPYGKLGLALEMALAALGFAAASALAILLKDDQRQLWRLRLRSVFARG